MKISTKTNIINVFEAQNILSKYTDICGILIDIDKCNQYCVEFVEELNNSYSIIRKLSGNDLKVFQRKNMFDFLTNILNIPYDKLVDKSGYSFTDKKIIELSMDKDISGDVKKVLSLISSMRSLHKRIYILQEYMKLRLVEGLSFEGHRMVLAKPKWNISTTEQLSSVEPDIQGIPGDMDIITHTKEQTIIYSYGQQVHARILWSLINDKLIKELTILYDDIYYALLHYCYLDCITEDRKGKEKLKKRDISVNERETLINILYNLTDINPTNPLHQKIKVKLLEHPKRIEFLRNTKESIINNNYIFSSPFGTRIEVKGLDKYRTEEDKLYHLNKCALIYPVKTVSSDLMKISIDKADKLISHYAQSTLTSIASCIHTNLIFYIHKNDKNLIEELISYLNYMIDDWIPIISAVSSEKRKVEKFDKFK